VGGANHPPTLFFIGLREVSGKVSRLQLMKGNTMMFYNGFNLMIDIIIVTIAVYYTQWSTLRNKKIIDLHELDYEYNEGYNAGYNYASSLNLQDRR
jgi:hypothetical protein